MRERTSTVLRDRQSNIQILRGTAIFAVVLIHTCPNGWTQVVCRPFVNFAVPLFLFLSGYLTKIDRAHWGTFYKKRISKVIFPYALWSILYSISNMDFAHIVTDLFTAKAAGHLYFIPVYIQFVLLTPLFGKLIRSKYHWVGWVIAPIATILFKYVWLFSGFELNTAVSTAYRISCLPWVTAYYLGLIIGNGYLEKNYQPRQLALLYLFSIGIQMGEGYIWWKLGDANCGSALKLSAMLSSAVFCLIANNFIKSKSNIFNFNWLVRIGDCSFGIYCSHILVLKVLRQIPGYDLLPFGVNSLIVMLTCFACVTIGQKICGQKLSRWLGIAAS